MTMLWPICWAQEPIRPGMMPYRCSRRRWHRGMHEARWDGALYAAWTRRQR